MEFHTSYIGVVVIVVRFSHWSWARRGRQQESLVSLICEYTDVCSLHRWYVFLVISCFWVLILMRHLSRLASRKAAPFGGDIILHSLRRWSPVLPLNNRGGHAISPFGHEWALHLLHLSVVIGAPVWIQAAVSGPNGVRLRAIHTDFIVIIHLIGHLLIQTRASRPLLVETG